MVVTLSRDALSLPTPDLGLDSFHSVPQASVSVVIPTKNEAKNIVWVLQRIPNLVDEVIIVDGLSTDGTVDIARHVFPDVTIVEERRSGKGAAVRAGFAAATSDYIVMLDADGSMDPRDIGRYLAFLTSGFDFVKGSRFMCGGGTADMTRLRRAGHTGLLRLANALYARGFTDLCYGYLAFRRSALPAMALSADGFEIEMQLIARAVRAGLRMAEIPSFEAARMHGVSNLHTFRDGWRVLRTLTRERFERRGLSLDDVE